MACPSALISLFDLFHQTVPCRSGEHFRGFPRFGTLLLFLPTNLAGKKGYPVGGFWAVAFRLFRPFDGAAHGGWGIRVRRGQQTRGLGARPP